MDNVGVFGSVPALVELAVLAEHSGWDGVHLWDHLLYHDPEWPVASPVATAAAVAAATERVRIVLTLTLPRRQVQDVAQDTAGIAALAGGRLTVLGIIGSMDREFTEFGLDPDLKARGRALDERLARPGGVLRDILYLTASEGERQHDPHPFSCGSHRGGSRYRARNRPFRVVVKEVVPQVYAVPAAVLGEHRQLHQRRDAPEDADVGSPTA